MKKIFALLFSAAMLATMSITAFAAETDGSAGSGQSEVLAHVYSSYNITIPATIDLRNGNESYVEISNANIEDGYTVKVFCSNTDVNGIRLYHDTKENTSITCSIFNSNGEMCDATTPMAVFTSSDISEGTGAKNITLEPETTGVPGNYSGTLEYTFSCSNQ